jgi:hypothetical protein
MKGEHSQAMKEGNDRDMGWEENYVVKVVKLNPKNHFTVKF